MENRLNEMTADNTNCAPKVERQIDELLDRLGMKKLNTKRQILKSALVFCYLNEGQLGNLTRQLYPYISKEMEISEKTVQNVIRWGVEDVFTGSFVYEIMPEDIISEKTGKVNVKKFLEILYAYLIRQLND